MLKRPAAADDAPSAAAVLKKPSGFVGKRPASSGPTGPIFKKPSRSDNIDGEPMEEEGEDEDEGGEEGEDEEEEGGEEEEEAEGEEEEDNAEEGWDEGEEGEEENKGEDNGKDDEAEPEREETSAMPLPNTDHQIPAVLRLRETGARSILVFRFGFLEANADAS